MFNYKTQVLRLGSLYMHIYILLCLKKKKVVIDLFRSDQIQILIVAIYYNCVFSYEYLLYCGSFIHGINSYRGYVLVDLVELSTVEVNEMYCIYEDIYVYLFHHHQSSSLTIDGFAPYSVWFLLTFIVCRLSLINV